MKLNKEELVTGAVFGFAWFWFLHWWLLLFVPMGALLWSLGGSEHKLYRRLGCALMAGSVVATTIGSPWGYFTWSLTLAVLCMGYGVPSTQPPDEGSWLGSRVFRLVRREKEASVIVRMIIAFLLGLSAVPLARESVAGWLIGCAVLVIGMPLAFLLAEGEIDV